ncbi:hypothetical protein ADZ36_04260 [Streptomyces fradiae]|uniref:Uncharacterized protein n=2 Tax=Streptomyces TaxID=1883 RepID=A0A3M8FD30_9ACTN|nr:hypothetical protein ADZ36_04260 [Streptomyces fradiae]OFA53277.1 hypothetical protein BEN35_09755 [Streptomyces fradiae]PQM25189.1 hypothetical protein Sfr7A_03360 [Streptomyces xinghaiensis]RKM99240.1 hypothetical protein SFRA_003360 [Streptomyces xinghaiensis]RNC75856.1 hypothetical protein DC095_001015 [Streptomyces xinghaiensis]
MRPYARDGAGTAVAGRHRTPLRDAGAGNARIPTVRAVRDPGAAEPPASGARQPARTARTAR